MGGFDVSYEYDAAEDKTLCRLVATWGGVAIGASTRRPGIYLELTRDGVSVFVDLSRQDVQRINSEMQRALAGCFEGEWPVPREEVVSTDPELERLLAEEEAIEKACAENERVREAQAMLREEDEMNQREHLEEVARANGTSAIWTARELRSYLERNVHPDSHVAIVPDGDSYQLVAID